jgi:hypothetical protein
MSVLFTFWYETVGSYEPWCILDFPACCSNTKLIVYTRQWSHGKKEITGKQILSLFLSNNFVECLQFSLLLSHSISNLLFFIMYIQHMPVLSRHCVWEREREREFLISACPVANLGRPPPPRCISWQGFRGFTVVESRPGQGVHQVRCFLAWKKGTETASETSCFFKETDAVYRNSSEEQSDCMTACQCWCCPIQCFIHEFKVNAVM